MSFDAAIAEIKRALSDPISVCKELGFLSGAKGSWVRQSAGVLIRCPVHAEKTPSCSVQRKGAGLLWKCHGCDASGDVLDLVAAARGLSAERDFREVLVEAASVARLHTLVADLERGEQTQPRQAPPTMAQDVVSEPERPYPPSEDVDALWGKCVPVTANSEGGAFLTLRGLDPERVFATGLVREIGVRTPLPGWASFRGQSWRDTGHLLIVPMYGHDGVMRSVRASRVVDAESPKRLPPGGFRASGIVMADDLALGMLRGTWKPERVVIAEGEPDFFSLATRTGIEAHAHMGIVSGSWTPEIAAKIPSGATVWIRTDNDAAGDRYAKSIYDSIGLRCTVKRKATT